MTQIPVWSKTKAGIAFSDVPTAQGGRMPAFCIIGAAKAGTSSLNAYLDHHPNVFMCPLKEPNYFSTPVMLARGEQWYRGLYAPASDTQICGEASTSYTRYPAVTGTAQRMAKANPAMKLVYCLREPVARVESDCLQVMKYARGVLDKDYTDMPLDDFYRLLCDPAHDLYCAPKEASDYALQLEQFEAHFPKDQIKLIETEQLGCDTQRVVDDILAFLGLEPSGAVDVSHRQNVTAEFTDGLREERGLAPLRGNPVYALAKALLPERPKAYLRKRLAKDVGHLRFSDTLRKELTAEFAGPNERLRQRYNLQLETW